MAINEGSFISFIGEKLEWETKCDDCADRAFASRPVACDECTLIGLVQMTNAEGVKQWCTSGVVTMAEVERKIEKLRLAALPEQLRLF